MNNQEKQKLNEKVAKFAGLEYQRCQDGEFYWVRPDGLAFSPTDIDGCPLFTDSLDDCFKWLVPKLGETLVGIDFIPPYHKQSEWLCNVEFDRVSLESYRAKGNTATLALCLAIEKLIDAKGEK